MPQSQRPFPPSGLEPGERWRAPYACRSSLSRGRLVGEPVSATRGEFQRDRDRIIHSTAFRRLKHKTQVFVSHEGDHYRTRLTHTIEVAQIARALARALGLDEDLAEALALAHDLGHTPFGHTGEDALDECMASFGGFDHNAQTLRIVTRLERRYADFDGLNLSWETLEGLVKHNGPLLDREGHPTERYARTGIPAAIVEYQHRQDLWLDSYASAEAQAAALADDIAYNAHDIDDGLRAGLFGHAELRSVPFLAGLLDEIGRLHPGLEKPRLTNELVRRIITRFVEDVIAESQARLAALAPADADAIRRAGQPVIAFSEAIEAADRDIKGFLYPNMYRHPRIAPIRAQAARVVTELFGRFSVDPAAMPEEWAAGCDGLDEPRGMRRIADYIAGMTDWYALDEHRRLFDVTPSLR
ncbi:deoxyguanosinetriphosphate triphosphohydrolase [Bosea thiooxidans]|nr:deoxyguanosinetriphosphate triphosphohydrolase [Bosea sp. (in: a-proteobacteria)]